MASNGDFRITINKWLLLGGAVLCLGTSGALWYFDSEADSFAAMWFGLLGALNRVGLILAALALVVPRGRRLRLSWKVFLIAAAMLVGIALRPKIAVPLVAILLAVAFILRPRDRTAKQKQLARHYRKRSTEQPSNSPD